MVGAFAKSKKVELRLICPKPKTDRADSILQNIERIHYIPVKSKSLTWHLTSQFNYLRQLWECRHSDVIVVRANPSIVLPILTTKIFDQKYIYLIRGVSSLNGEKIGRLSYLGSISMEMNIKSADKIVTAYKEVEEVMNSRGWNVSNKIEQFPNAVDISKFTPMPVSDARHSLELPFSSEDFVVGFVGSLRKRHQLQPLMNAIIKCSREGTPVKLLIVGDGPERTTLQSLSDSLGLNSEVVFTGHIPHEEVSRYISACNTLYGVADETRPSNPIKCYEYLACERPVITTQTPELEFVSSQEAGIVIDEIAPEKIKDAISEFYHMEADERSAMGNRGREYVINHQTWDQLVDLCLKDERTTKDKPQPQTRP